MAEENPLPGHKKVVFQATPFSGWGMTYSGHLPEDKVAQIEAILKAHLL